MRGLVLLTVIALLLAAPLLWRIDSELDMPDQATGEWQSEGWAARDTGGREVVAPRGVPSIADLSRVPMPGIPTRD